MLKRSIYGTTHAAGDLDVAHSSLGITCPSVLWTRVEQWIHVCNSSNYKDIEMYWAAAKTKTNSSGV